MLFIVYDNLTICQQFIEFTKKNNPRKPLFDSLGLIYFQSNMLFIISLSTSQNT